MGTSSRIGVMHGDTIKSVYVHWDGSPDTNGRILQEHYNSSKANHLVALGNINSLGTMIGEKHDFDKSYPIGSPESTWTKFYGRDRGEDEQEYEANSTFVEFLDNCNQSGAEYYYVMKDGVWYVGDTYENSTLSNKLVLLTDVLN